MGASIDSYKEALKRDFDIDLGDLTQKNEGCSGIYVETAYLMAKLIAHPHTQRVFEAGAGLSTMVYAIVARQYEKFFVSLEDKEEWADKFNRNLELVSNLVGDFQIVKTESDPNKCPQFSEQFQLVWIDGNIAWHADKGMPGSYFHRPGAVRYYQNVMKDALIIFDDGEDTHCRVEIDKVMTEMGRRPSDCFIWNPTGRHDRHQWICPPPNGTPLLDIVRAVENLE